MELVGVDREDQETADAPTLSEFLSSRSGWTAS
jgi:hypothetical protein